MSRFSGPQGAPRKHGRPNKGVARLIREQKREEAEERNARTPLERTRAYREGRVVATNPDSPQEESRQASEKEEGGLADDS